MTDETRENGQLINFPVTDDVRNSPPQLPDLGRLFPTPESDPDSEAGGGGQAGFTLPSFTRPMGPESAVNSTMNSGGINDLYSSPNAFGDGAANSDGETDGGYVHRRSFADRIGDWIEYRINRGQGRHDAEAPYRTAEGERKAALLKARTETEVEAIRQNGKLEGARVKAGADLAAARGKSRSDNAKSGGGRGAAGGGKRPGGATNASGGGRQPTKPKGGPTPPKPTPSKPIAPKKDNLGGNQVKPPTRGDRGKTPAQNQPKNTPRKDAPKDTRIGGGKKTGPGAQTGASKKDPSTGGSTKRDQKPKDTTNGSKKQSGGGAAGGSPKKVNLRKDTGAARGGAGTTRKHNRSVLDRDHPRKDGAKTPGPRKVDLTKNQKPKGASGSGKNTGNGGAQAASDGPSKGAGAPGPGGASKAANGPSSASGDGNGKGASNRGRDTAGADSENDVRRPWEGREQPPKQPHGKQRTPGPDSGTQAGPRWWNSRKQKPHSSPESQTAGPVAADSVGITVERADRPQTGNRTPQDAKGPVGITTGTRGLPAAPEPHTQRPGTSRTNSKESPVPSGTPTTVTSGGPAQRLAAEHQTDISLGEYLTEITNIAVASDTHKDRAEQIASALGQVADALRDMSTDLVADHNIAPQVTDLIANLADDAGRMKLQAERAAEECGNASQAAVLAGMSVAQTYNRDVQAMDDAGLTFASSAAHH